jgi:outer membrane biosynthesis protein TonB
MSDSDRGAYTPPTADAPLAFDARQPVRGARPVPMTLIVSGVVLLILVAAIVFFYRSGVRQEGQAPQAVGTPVGEMKAAAPDSAQPSDPAASLQIYQDEATPAPAAPTFTPPPETPAPRAAPTTQVAQAPTPLPPAQPAGKAVDLKPAQPAPAPKTAAPAATPAPKAAEPAKPAATPAPAKTASGVAGVQIGAFSSKALADAGWNDAARIAPGAIAGKGKTVEPVQVNGSTLYRTTVTGFSSRSDAQQFCQALKAAGKNCFVK